MNLLERVLCPNFPTSNMREIRLTEEFVFVVSKQTSSKIRQRITAHTVAIVPKHTPEAFCVSRSPSSVLDLVTGPD